MGQQSLIYSFVPRGTMVLAEYTEFKGNFTSIAAQCLQKLPASNNKFTYNCDNHTFKCLVEDGFGFDPFFWLIPQCCPLVPSTSEWLYFSLGRGFMHGAEAG